MFSLFENLIAARSKPKGDDWIQFVVIIAIIGFSVIKTFIRAKSAAFKRQPEQDDDSSPKPPVPKKYASDGGYKTLQQLRDEKRAQIRAAFGIPTPLEDKKLISTLSEPPRLVKKTEKPLYHAKTARPSAKEVSKKPSGVSAPLQTEADDTYKLLFSSPQDLRTAVLYYEILGKPVSLRDAV
jgi:hypothetical protein